MKKQKDVFQKRQSREVAAHVKKNKSIFILKDMFKLGFKMHSSGFQACWPTTGSDIAYI